MIDLVVDQWHDKKDNLREWLESNEPNNYKHLLKKTLELVVNDPVKEDYPIEPLDAKRIDVVDHGRYQGTQIFMIPQDTHQPQARNYVWLDNYYGSCSGCDTFASICSWNDEPPTDEQVDRFMRLALHMIQRMEWLDTND